MAYIGYIKLWENQFDKVVPRTDKMQDLNINQIKLEVHDSYKKDEKITTNFETANDENVMHKA